MLETGLGFLGDFIADLEFLNSVLKAMITFYIRTG